MVWDAMKLIQETKQHTIVLTTAQLKEVILACDYPSWENEDFLSAEQILINALNGEQA
jgi:ABC-type multidrug transport system ATPase subunit